MIYTIQEKKEISKRLKERAINEGFTISGIASIPGSSRLKLRTKALDRWISNNHLPTKFLAIKPISKIANKGTVKPKVRLIKSCNKGFKLIKGFSCFGTEVTNVKTNLLTNDDSQIVVAKGITTNNPAIRSFLRSC